MEEYGLKDDNPVFDGIFDYCCSVAGSSIKCAKLLLETKYPKHSKAKKQGYENRIIFNYGGGRHHGRSDKAEGFCYINDIVIMIDYLRQHDVNNQFERIL